MGTVTNAQNRQDPDVITLRVASTPAADCFGAAVEFNFDPSSLPVCAGLALNGQSVPGYAVALTTGVLTYNIEFYSDSNCDTPATIGAHANPIDVGASQTCWHGLPGASFLSLSLSNYG
jgi:hypothetical protein